MLCLSCTSSTCTFASFQGALGGRVGGLRLSPLAAICVIGPRKKRQKERRPWA